MQIEFAARVRKGTDLSLLGLNTSERPSLSRFPPTFNPKAVHIWRALMESSEFQSTRYKSGTPHDLWLDVIQKYLKACEAENLFPFSRSADFEETARKFLRTARQELAAFFKKHEVFKYMRVASVDRSFQFTDRNFTIIGDATLRPIEDPTLTSYLTRAPEPRFRLHEEGYYTKNVRAGVDVEFHGGKIPHLKYKIFCHTAAARLQPELPTPSRLSSYLDKNLWLPLVREHPFEGVGRRLF